MIRRLLCWLNLHRMCFSVDRTVPRRAACLYCGAQFEGLYDPTYGDTVWKRV
jgi:hypothetical protein